MNNGPKVRRSVTVAGLCIALAAIALVPGSAQAQVSMRGPLRASSINPRYFTDDTGRAIYLTGTHTWDNLQDEGPAPNFAAAPKLDYDRYLQFLGDNSLNFVRLWLWEQARYASWGGGNPDYYFGPLPYARSSVCCALDGGNKFDLTKFNPEFFGRLRQRVMAAGARGIYVSVMLFQGWSIVPVNQNPWPGNPYNGANNINGVDATDANGDGLPSHEPNPTVWPYQRAYIHHVIDAVGDLDNVLYEVSNEDQDPNAAKDLEWQNQVVDEIHTYERQPGHEPHPVGITKAWPYGTDQQLVGTHADWISPATSDASFDPGGKVVIWDTDHVTGVGITADQAWKAFTNGWNPISMDHSRYTSDSCDVGLIDPEDGVVPLASDWRSSCGDLAMGDTARYAQRMNLIRALPQPATCSTRQCLVYPGHEYLVYQPEAGAPFTVTLRPGRYRVEWFDTGTHTVAMAPSVQGPGDLTFQPPFGDQPAVLFLSEGSSRP